eukprot:973381-Prymnesium_polylepis.2
MRASRAQGDWPRASAAPFCVFLSKKGTPKSRFSRVPLTGCSTIPVARATRSIKARHEARRRDPAMEMANVVSSTISAVGDAVNNVKHTADTTIKQFTEV